MDILTKAVIYNEFNHIEIQISSWNNEAIAASAKTYGPKNNLLTRHG